MMVSKPNILIDTHADDVLVFFLSFLLAAAVAQTKSKRSALGLIIHHHQHHQTTKADSTGAEAKARLANWLRTVEDVGGLHTLGHQ
jgi:hypothetical protein